MLTPHLTRTSLTGLPSTTSVTTVTYVFQNAHQCRRKAPRSDVKRADPTAGQVQSSVNRMQTAIKELIKELGNLSGVRDA